jgi:hypothetical protein
MFFVCKVQILDNMEGIAYNEKGIDKVALSDLTKAMLSLPVLPIFVFHNIFLQKIQR